MIYLCFIFHNFGVFHFLLILDFNIGLLVNFTFTHAAAQKKAVSVIKNNYLLKIKEKQNVEVDENPKSEVPIISYMVRSLRLSSLGILVFLYSYISI